MNLSGKSVKYWMDKEKISIENVLVVTDDVHLDFGTIRLKAKGSAGGHNGLKDIQDKLNTQQYARFRFGVGGNYSKGRQADFVLGEWNKEETSQLIERLPVSSKMRNGCVKFSCMRLNTVHTSSPLSSSRTVLSN